MLVGGRVGGMASALRDILCSLATLNNISLNGVTAKLHVGTRRWWSHRSSTCMSSVWTGREANRNQEYRGKGQFKTVTLNTLKTEFQLIVSSTFTGLCIVIYFYIKTNEMHQFLKFILFCSSTLHVSDGLSVHHQESKTVHTASGIHGYVRQILVTACYGNEMELHEFHLAPANKHSAESVWHIPDTVCTVLDFWWWTERPYETCRVLIQNGARCGAVGWGTALQAGRSRVRFPMVPSEFFIEIILPAAIWPWGWLNL